MPKRVVAHQYDHQWNEMAHQTFQFVEDAQAWCEAKVGSLHWGDTQIGLEGLVPEHTASLDATGDYAPGFPIFQISATYNEDPDQNEELYCFHYDPVKMTDKDLKYAWEEATRFAEDAPEGHDQWKIVEELEAEINTRGLINKQD